MELSQSDPRLCGNTKALKMFLFTSIYYLDSVLLLIMCISHHFIDHTIWMLLKMQHLKLLQLCAITHVHTHTAAK